MVKIDYLILSVKLYDQIYRKANGKELHFLRNFCLVGKTLVSKNLLKTLRRTHDTLFVCWFSLVKLRANVYLWPVHRAGFTT